MGGRAGLTVVVQPVGPDKESRAAGGGGGEPGRALVSLPGLNINRSAATITSLSSPFQGSGQPVSLHILGSPSISVPAQPWCAGLLRRPPPHSNALSHSHRQLDSQYLQLATLDWHPTFLFQTKIKSLKIYFELMFVLINGPLEA